VSDLSILDMLCCYTPNPKMLLPPSQKVDVFEPDTLTHQILLIDDSGIETLKYMGRKLKREEHNPTELKVGRRTK